MKDSIRGFFIFVLASLSSITIPTISLAQTTVPATSGDFWAQIQAIILTVVSTVITLLMGLLVAYAKQKWNIEIDANRRETLQTALTQAAGLLLQNLGKKAANMKNLNTADPDVQKAIQYVKDGAPDGIKQWSLSDEDIALKLEGKLGVLTGATGSGGATPVVVAADATK